MPLDGEPDQCHITDNGAPFYVMRKIGGRPLESSSAAVNPPSWWLASARPAAGER